jgi:hypothetical protein
VHQLVNKRLWQYQDAWYGCKKNLIVFVAHAWKVRCMKLKGTRDRRRENCFLTTLYASGELSMSTKNSWNNNWGGGGGGRAKYSGTQRRKRMSDSHFIHQKAHMDWLGSGCDSRWKRSATNRLNHFLTRSIDLSNHPHGGWLVVRIQHEKYRTSFLIL